MNPSGAARLPALDMARGLAVLAMFGFHFVWDLGHFGHIDPDLPYSLGVKLFGHAIAIAFLFISGVSLTLARRKGSGWRGFAKRFVMIAGAAGLVSLGTYALFPGAFVFFGILHCIAAASLIALPFLILPWPAALGGALVLAAAPLLASSTIFDGPGWGWLGLSTITPSSNDYRPVMPWAGAVLAGVAFAKARGLAVTGAAVTGDASEGAVATAASWLGRHSLAAYLLHQPLFFVGFMALALLSPAADPTAEFVAACVVECRKGGGGDSRCKDACACTAAAVSQQRLLSTVADDAERSRRIGDLARACFKAAPGG